MKEEGIGNRKREVLGTLIVSEFELYNMILERDYDKTELKKISSQMLNSQI